MDSESTVREIVLPEMSPATEWIGDRPVQRPSPTRRHGMLQLAIGIHVQRWACGQGDVGTVWTFRITPRASYTRPLVPGVAYLSFERSRGLSHAERETPAVAPDLVIEVVSPDHRPGDVALKREQYLSAGTTFVVIVDQKTRRVDAYDDRGLHSSAIAPAAFETELFPELSIPFAELFEEIDAR